MIVCTEKNDRFSDFLTVKWVPVAQQEIKARCLSPLLDS